MACNNIYDFATNSTSKVRHMSQQEQAQGFDSCSGGPLPDEKNINGLFQDIHCNIKQSAQSISNHESRLDDIEAFQDRFGVYTGFETTSVDMQAETGTPDTIPGDYSTQLMPFYTNDLIRKYGLVYAPSSGNINEQVYFDLNLRFTIGRLSGENNNIKRVQVYIGVLRKTYLDSLGISAPTGTETSLNNPTLWNQAFTNNVTQFEMSFGVSTLEKITQSVPMPRNMAPGDIFMPIIRLETSDGNPMKINNVDPDMRPLTRLGLASS